jgi:hypothetical protein
MDKTLASHGEFYSVLKPKFDDSKTNVDNCSTCSEYRQTPALKYYLEWALDG